ncbi:MAG: M91 family zinc metallopeptidase [Pyrinomonadaceae bacterium]
MRYWGKNIEIDGSFYQTEMGKKLLPTAAEKAQWKAMGSYFQYEGNVEFYEVTVQNMMREIAGNKVGQILIRAINQSAQKLRIIPLTSKEQAFQKKIPCANPVGGYNPKGNACVIWYEPWSRIPNLIFGGNSPYQVLVHELQHAVRQMRGKWYNTGAVGGFPNSEELFSVLIENMYLSAAGQPERMVGAYDQGIPLGNRSDKDFLKQYFNEISVWCDQMKDLTVQLELIHSIWNPIRVRRSVLDLIITL